MKKHKDSKDGMTHHLYYKESIEPIPQSPKNESSPLSNRYEDDDEDLDHSDFFMGYEFENSPIPEVLLIHGQVILFLESKNWL